ncbi:MAG: hypothetical protein ACRBBN_11600 [Methyloligellaceae bacterium]
MSISLAPEFFAKHGNEAAAEAIENLRYSVTHGDEDRKARAFECLESASCIKKIAYEATQLDLEKKQAGPSAPISGPAWAQRKKETEPKFYYAYDAKKIESIVDDAINDPSINPNGWSHVGVYVEEGKQELGRRFGYVGNDLNKIYNKFADEGVAEGLEYLGPSLAGLTAGGSAVIAKTAQSAKTVQGGRRRRSSLPVRTLRT